jgi:hypothetical protein
LVALIDQDRFLDGYLQAALERQGAVVTTLHGPVDGMMALLQAAGPRPAVAVLDSKLSDCCELIDLLERLKVPFLLVAQGNASPLAIQRPGIPLWRWPFAAFQVAAALVELLDARATRDALRT